RSRPGSYVKRWLSRLSSRLRQEAAGGRRAPDSRAAGRRRPQTRNGRSGVLAFGTYTAALPFTTSACPPMYREVRSTQKSSPGPGAARPRTIAVLALLLSLAFTTASGAQQRAASALDQMVDGLGISARVLVIAAPPDDEDTNLVAWLARGRHVETAYLSLTRGDGGQNLIGN